MADPLVNGSHASESDGFVAVDISALSALSDEPNNNNNKKMMIRSMSRKGGDTNCTGGAHVAGEKQDVHVHVEVCNGDHTNGHTVLATPNPASKFRRMNSRRVSPWLNPRRVLFVFATL